MQKRSEIQRDEWAKMYKFQHEIGTLQGKAQDSPDAKALCL